MVDTQRTRLRDKLLRYIPVYGAYKVEEELREWDRSVRDEAVLYLTRGEAQLTTLLEHAVTRRDRPMIAQIERTRKQAHGLKEQLRTAVAGYFPRFSPIQIREDALREALDLDEHIVQQTQTFAAKLAVLAQRFPSDETAVLLDLEALHTELRQIQTQLTRRAVLFRTGSPEEAR